MNKQISILSLIVVMAIGAGVWIFQQSNSNDFETEWLFSDIQSKATEIDSVSIENSQGILFEATKLDGQWLAKVGYSEERYPADEKSLAGLVNTILQAKLVEAKTSNKSKHDRLGLQSITVEDSLARLVTIKAGQRSWQVLIGNNVAVGEGQYARLPKESQSWRLDKNVDLPIEQYEWLRHPILPYAVADIESISRADGQGWQVVTNGSEAHFQLRELPQGKTLQYDGILDGYVSTFVNLDYEELVSPEQTFIDSLQELVELEVVTKQGESFKLRLSQSKDIFYVNVDTAENTQYWQQWYYQISSYSASQLNKTLDDFIQKPVEAPSPTADSTPIEEGSSPQ